MVGILTGAATMQNCMEAPENIKDGALLSVA